MHVYLITSRFILTNYLYAIRGTPDLKSSMMPRPFESFLKLSLVRYTKRTVDSFTPCQTTIFVNRFFFFTTETSWKDYEDKKIILIQEFALIWSACLLNILVGINSRLVNFIDVAETKIVRCLILEQVLR